MTRRRAHRALDRPVHIGSDRRWGIVRFQSAPPHGGRPWRTHEQSTMRRMLVSIRAPARGATARARSQSAPPHWGRRAVHAVSIRAPARGAPRLPWPHHISARWRASQPRRCAAIPLRARFRRRPDLSASSFNPRPRTGGDRGRSKRPDELRLAWSLREPCMVVDVPHSCKTFVSSQHLDWDVVTARANLHART